jgi:general secretion pathway protein G
MKPRQAAGFTLIELIVVIAIITLLMAFLALFISHIGDTAKNAKAKALVDTLDAACRFYRDDNGVYPPNTMGDSRNLHYSLGRPRVVSMGGTIQARRPPYIDFQADWLQLARGQSPDPTNPVPVIDPWGNPIQYVLPGVYSAPAPDIWSRGANGKDDLVPPGGATDDLCNWIKDR